jgi:hypothetical protein
MPAQKYPPVFPLAHHRNSTPQPISVAAGTSRERRSMRTLAAERQIESQNREPRRRKRIGHLHQKFRLTIRPSAMRKHNGLSSTPRRLVQPPKNARLTTNIFESYCHLSLGSERKSIHHTQTQSTK